MRTTTSLLKIPVLVGTVLGLVLGSSPSVGAAPMPAAAPVSQAGRSPAIHRYRLVDLGTLGGQSSFATAMNDRGDVVGRAQTSDGVFHGFLWRHRKMTDLGPFSPVDINNKGQVVGGRDDVDGVYLWHRGRLRRLGADLTFARAINDRGQVLALKAVEGGQDVPALWFRGTAKNLPLQDVSDLNNRGQVSGGRITSGGFHAAVWRRGRVTDLGAAAFDRSNTYGLNNQGWVIGWTFSEQQDERGALWRHGLRTDLGTLGGSHTHPVAINDRGSILVTSQVADGNDHPALWRRGVLTDLTAAGVSADGDLNDYNDRGEIAASIRPVFGTSHAVVYRPHRR